MLLILTHNRKSKSAKLLRDSFRALGIDARLTTSTRRRSRSTILNWGHQRAPKIAINHNANSDKLASFRALELAGVSIPRFTPDRYIAQQWIDQGLFVLSRQLTRASEGRGIVEGIAPAPLYVQFLPKRAEYRVHLANDRALIYRKRRKNGSPQSRIWNHQNGYVFSVRHNAPDYILAEAQKALNALGLDFGAVDVLEYKNRPYVLEVNTAPGLCPKTASFYVSSLIERIA